MRNAHLEIPLSTKRVPSSLYNLQGLPTSDTPIFSGGGGGGGTSFKDQEIVNNPALYQSLFCSSSYYTVQT